MTARPPVFLGLGSNLGDREENLTRGLAGLEAEGFGVIARSSLYETEPVGGPPQGPYLNQVVRGETDLTPEALLAACLRVEAALGRVRRERFGPRTLDLDILIYGDRVQDAPGLELPHPRLHERLFVLVPLAEVGADAVHPRLGLTLRELKARCPDTSRVLLYASAGARA
ncbi:MAG: 2-amino-4-hydroxy-6-hydroxymethyldihydropteridine diphosphokinase [Vicinamibacteria bacterium]